MKILGWIALICLPLAVSSTVLSQPAEPASGKCAGMTSLTLPHAAINGAVMVGAAANHPAYCRISGSAHPTSDSDIRFEVWIPENWNGRYVQYGNGGFAGVIPERGMLLGIAQGYAVAGTDDGHQTTDNTDASWALNRPEKQIDFGYRALKETTDAAKTIIAAYGAAPKYSYFFGCSDGGREAMMEAQRYPNDFNGIIAGDPANHWTHLLAGAAAGVQVLNRTPGSWISPTKLALIQAEAVKQCGDADGVIQDPLTCHFQPSKIRCTSGDAPNCLTNAELATLTAIYRGAINPRTHEKVISGFSPGGEDGPNGWGRWISGQTPGGKDALIHAFAANFFRYIVFADPGYDIMKLNMDSDVAMTDAKFASTFNSYDPDLSAFKARGGKLIHYHGWADPAIPAMDSIDYYKSVQARMGNTSDFYRLFMAPGMLHCGGGPGPNSLATLPAIRAWVEDGKAPDRIMATKYQDDDAAKLVVRTRPLCAFPAFAKWDGKGDRSKMESFRCIEPKG